MLTTLLLLRAGYEYVSYSSLERVVEENKDTYYRALRKAQTTLDEDESELGVWVDFFLRSLVQQQDVLVHRIERERLVAPMAPTATPSRCICGGSWRAGTWSCMGWARERGR